MRLLRTSLTALSLIVLHEVFTCGAQCQDYRDVATLSAGRQSYSWQAIAPGSTDTSSINGRHDALGLRPKSQDILADVFMPQGLVIHDDTIPPERLQIILRGISEDGFDAVFSASDSSIPYADLMWIVDSSVDQAATDFWPGSVVVFGGGLSVGGEVGGQILVIGGDVIVREAATVRGPVAVIGGILRQRGDGKIYGQTFAPGGHRRPRLSVTRAWEFEEEEGFHWAPVFSYDRVDGARPGVNARFQHSPYSPGVSLFGGFAFSTETWQYNLKLRQRVSRALDLELHAGIFRLTETEDEAWVGRLPNTLYALVAGSDYRDYYGADGGEVGLTYKYRERGILSLAYRTTEHRWLIAEPGLWHLFRPDHDFRDNFSTVPPEFLESWMDDFEERSSALHVSVGVEPHEPRDRMPSLDVSFRANAEIAGGSLGGDFDYDRWQLSGSATWSERSVHRLTSRVWYGTGRRDLPPHKLFFLGGVGSLPGYRQKTLVGDQAVLGTVEYRFTYWVNRVLDGGVILFFDAGRSTFDDNFWDISEFKSDIGIGLGLGNQARLDFAKGIDRADRDIRVSVRFGSHW